jgi:hypothetical protein
MQQSVALQAVWEESMSIATHDDDGMQLRSSKISTKWWQQFAKGSLVLYKVSLYHKKQPVRESRHHVVLPFSLFPLSNGIRSGLVFC